MGSVLDRLVLRNVEQRTSQRGKWTSEARNTINLFFLFSSYFVARSLDRSIARSLDHSITRSLDHSITRSLDHSIARSLDRPIDRSLDRGIAGPIARPIARPLARSPDVNYVKLR